MSLRRWGLALFVLATAHLGACGRAITPAPDLLRVVVSIPPQRQFVERIAGHRVSVTVMVPPGADAHTYEPKPAQLRALSRAQVYLGIGIEFEKVWMARLLGGRTDLTVVDTSQGIALQPLPAAEGRPSGGALDPHIWLSPGLVAIQARTIATALSEADPAHAAEYEENLRQFLAEIASLDASIRETLAGLRGREFMVFHPSWGYFARDYGLTMLAIEVEGQEPSAQELAAILARARADGIHVVFAQPSLSRRTAEIIARELGAEVVLIDPLAEDWHANLLTAAEAIARGLR